MEIKIETVTEGRGGLADGALVFSFTDSRGTRYSGNTYTYNGMVHVHAVFHYTAEADGVTSQDFSIADGLCGTLNADAEDMETELREALNEWMAVIDAAKAARPAFIGLD